MRMITYFIMCVAMMFAFQATSFAFSTQGFQNPYGVVVDAKGAYIYVSNVNGSPTERDGNGFISRLKGDGSLDQLKFIDGSVKETILHAPKGMAIVGANLYVADIDRLCVFDLSSGKFAFDVNFGPLPVQHFYDISAGPDDALYLADGAANVIYRIDVPRMHEVTTFASGDVLGQPRGLCWYPVRQVFLVTGWGSGQVIALDRLGKRQAIPGIFLGGPGQIKADGGGTVYVASTALSAVFKIAANYVLSSFGLGLNSPTGLAYQGSNNHLIITSFDGGTVQSFEIPQSAK